MRCSRTECVYPCSASVLPSVNGDDPSAGLRGVLWSWLYHLVPYKMPSTGPDIQVRCLFPKHLTFHGALNLIWRFWLEARRHFWWVRVALVAWAWQKRTLLHPHDTCIESSPPAPQRNRPGKGSCRPCFRGELGGRRNGITSSIDSGKGQGPAGECSTAHLKGSPLLAMASAPAVLACSAGVSHLSSL